MKVEFTREEKLISEEFASTKLCDPCAECYGMDRNECLADCPDKESYEKSYNRELEKYREHFPEFSIRYIADRYVSAYMEVANMRKEFDKIKSKLENAENKLKLFEEMG